LPPLVGPALSGKRVAARHVPQPVLIFCKSLLRQCLGHFSPRFGTRWELSDAPARPFCVPAVSDDAQLIEQTLAGRSAAFGELVCKYQDRLFNTIAHVAGNAEDARDIVQDAFVQAFLKLESFEHHAAFYTWLYRIAFNVAISHHRSRRRAVSIEQAKENAGEEPVDAGEGAEIALLRKERCQQVRDAIARLKEEYRAVVVLREIDGCCYETIAEILDVPIGTVRSRLYRGRAQLMEELKELFAAEETPGP